MIKRSIPWYSQPQYPVRVNASYAVTSAFTPIDQTGLSVTGSPSDTVGVLGRLKDISGSNASLYRTATSAEKTAAASILWLGELKTAPSTAASLGGTTYDNANSAPYVGIELKRSHSTAANSIYLNFNNTSAENSLVSSANYETGRVLVIGTVKDGAQSLYIKNLVTGAIEIVTGTVAGSIAYTSTSRFEVGDSLNARAPAAACALQVLFGKALSDAEARQILQNPWQIFEPRKQNIYVSAASGGTTLVSASDSLTPSFTESLALLSASSVSDTATPSISESVGLAVLVSATDTLTPSVTETAEVIAAVMASDTLTPSLVEAQASFVSSALSEAFTLSLGETQSSLLSSAVTDVATVSVSESAAVLVAMVGSDTYIVSITDSAAVTTADTIAKAVTETFTLSLTEVASIVTASLWTDKAVAITVWTDKPDASTTWTVQ